MKGRPHRTPAQRMQRLLDAMLRWLPERQFVFVGDCGFGTHEFGTHRDEFFIHDRGELGHPADHRAVHRSLE